MARARKNGIPANFNRSIDTVTHMDRAFGTMYPDDFGRVYGNMTYMHLVLAMGGEPQDREVREARDRHFADWSPTDHAVAAVVGLAHAGRLTHEDETVGVEVLLRVLIDLQREYAERFGIDEDQLDQRVKAIL
jgi:hypothetical protein